MAEVTEAEVTEVVCAKRSSTESIFIAHFSCHGFNAGIRFRLTFKKADMEPPPITAGYFLLPLLCNMG